MLKFLSYRLLATIPTLLIVSVLAFALMHLLPGSMARLIVGDTATPEQVAEVEARLGLDDPLPAQYVRWTTDALRGDFGESLVTQPGRSVTAMLSESLPPTLSLAGMSILIMVGVGIPLGVAAAARSGGFLDRAITVATSVWLAIPTFWMAILLVRWFAAELGWFRSFGYTGLSKSFTGWLGSVILPSIALAGSSAAIIARQTRGAMIETLQADYVRTALARGVSRRGVLFRHALRNALVPVVTMIGIQSAFVLGGSLIVEQVFGIAGLGRLATGAVLNQDVPVLQAFVVVMALMVILVNLLVDVAYGFLNPKVRPS
jgi:peptide/nickel transport system permease protein